MNENEIKIIIKVTKELRQAMKVLSAQLGITMTELINKTLQDRINKEGK